MYGLVVKDNEMFVQMDKQVNEEINFFQSPNDRVLKIRLGNPAPNFFNLQIKLFLLIQFQKMQIILVEF